MNNEKQSNYVEKAKIHEQDIIIRNTIENSNLEDILKALILFDNQVYEFMKKKSNEIDNLKNINNTNTEKVSK